MMKIAILNLSNNGEISYTLNYLEKIHNEIIDASIDLFIHKDQVNLIKDNKYINQVIPLDMDRLNIFNFKSKLDTLKYYTKNKYNIAIDTQGTLKSSFFTYNLSGKTAGFKRNSLFGLIASNFYDEKISIKSKIEQDEQTYKLFSKTFGFNVSA